MGGQKLVGGDVELSYEGKNKKCFARCSICARHRIYGNLLSVLRM